MGRKRNRMGVLKRQRELRKVEKAAEKRARQLRRKSEAALTARTSLDETVELSEELAREESPATETTTADTTGGTQ